MDTPTSGRRNSSHSGEGSSTSGAPGHVSEQSLDPAPQAGDLLPSRSDQRVRTFDDVKKLKRRLRLAFEAGDPQEVWTISKEVLEALESTIYTEGSLRFKTNFGTTVCDNCTGLRAGPGVAATCFQRKLCYFSNFREVASPE